MQEEEKQEKIESLESQDETLTHNESKSTTSEPEEIQAPKDVKTKNKGKGGSCKIIPALPNLR